MDKPLRPIQIWMIESEDRDPPYCALVVYRDVNGPRQYAPEEKRKLGLRACGIGMMTFHPAGLLFEGTSKDEIAEYLKRHREILATREQLDAYHTSRKV